MAAESIVLGLLALCLVMLLIGYCIGVMCGYAGRVHKESSLHTESERVRCYGPEKEGRTGAKTEDDLSPKGRQTFGRRWHGTRKHAKRDDSARRLRAAVPIFGLILGAFLVPTLAFADDGGNVWGPQVLGWDDGNVVGVMTVADNKYNAALFALGYDPNDTDTFNEVVKAKLSNESTGSSFYTFAQLFETGQPLWFPNYENVSGVYFTVVTLYGAERVYSARYETVHSLQARIALEAVLNGGGSGGGVAPVEGVYYFDLSWNKCPDRSNASPTRNYALYQDAVYDPETNTASGGSASYYYTNSYSGNTPVFPESMQVRLSSGAFDGISPDYSKYDYLVLYGIASNYYGSCEIWQLPKGSYEVFETTNSEGNSYYNIRLDESVTYYNVGPSGSNWRCKMYMTDGVFYTVGNVVSSPSTTSAGTKTLCVTSSSHTGRGYYGFIDVGTSVPPTNWPVPVDPHIWQAPRLPEPTMPIYPDPVDEPIYTPDPTMPIPTPEDGPTYTTADLSAVLDAMNSHCIHLQSTIYGAASQFWGLLSSKMTNDLSAFTSWLGDWLEVIADNITDGILHLENYLYSLAEWLAEQFDYSITASEYNDGSVVAWLKKIWAKLGTGTVNTRPDDPVADPIGIGNWLGTLFDNLISTLLGLGSELLGDISEDLDTLTGKFPFSIPWDIAAILVLFVSDPVTPVVEFPWYTVTTEGLVSTPVVVDCAPYDGYMVVVRTVELVIFGAGLAWRTKDIVEVLGSVGGDW